MTGQAIAMPAATDRSGEDCSARLGTLFDTHQPRLYRLARRLSASAEDARDVVQETFLRAARCPASVPAGTPNEEAWLVRVLINICRDRWRRLAVQRHGVVTGRVAGPQAPDPEPALIARSLVQQALGTLSPRRRAIVVMYELEGASIPAIARMLGVTAVTVRWHLSIGRREMARALESEGRP